MNATTDRPQVVELVPSARALHTATTLMLIALGDLTRLWLETDSGEYRQWTPQGAVEGAVDTYCPGPSELQGAIAVLEDVRAGMVACQERELHNGLVADGGA